MRTIYKYPIISIILINLFTLSLTAYLYNYNYCNSFVFIFLPLIGIFNYKILKDGVGINNKKMVFIIISIIVISAAFLLCIYNILLNRYI